MQVSKGGNNISAYKLGMTALGALAASSGYGYKTPSISKVASAVGKVTKSLTKKRKVYPSKKTTMKRKASNCGKEMTKVKKRIRDLSRRAEEGETTLKYRWRRTASVLALGDEVTHNATYGWTQADMSSILDQIQYYNPTTGEFDTRDFDTGTKTKSINIDYVGFELLLKNNYQSNVKCTIWKAFPKIDTNTDLVTHYNANIGRSVINAVPTPAAQFHPLLTFSDCGEATSEWRMQKVGSFQMGPGQSRSFYHNVKNIEVERIRPTTLFTRRYKAFTFLIRVEGGDNLVHANNDATKVGYGQCGVDLAYNMRATVRYDGGINAERIYLEYTKPVTDALAVFSSKPVVDNLQYSVA